MLVVMGLYSGGFRLLTKKGQPPRSIKPWNRPLNVSLFKQIHNNISLLLGIGAVGYNTRQSCS